MIDEINDEATFAPVLEDEESLQFMETTCRASRSTPWLQLEASRRGGRGRRAAAAARGFDSSRRSRRSKTDRPPDAPARRVRGRGPGERAEAR